MKTKLLFLTLLTVAFTATTNGQDKIWDFGGLAPYTSAEQIAMWPVVDFSAGEGLTVIKDGLTLVGDSSGDKFGKIENSGGKTWDEGTDDEYKTINRFKFEGSAGAIGTVLPTYSYLSFPVTGNVDIKIWYRASGDSSGRELNITDGTNVLAKVDGNGNTDPLTLTASKTGAGTIYIFGTGNSFNLYKIQVTSVATANTKKFNANIKAIAKAIGNKIYISNVEKNTEITIYSITGALVKKINTNKDTDFLMKPGVWIAKIKTDKGIKSLKLLTQ
ncbi:hypothetical protein BW723_03475 [Polaribacter reichenbachii]|uniref:Secretion system C-terminal sorting domain-containing protein n=1 Tax=Polaribacter reichenbachii TaxID=996801 RepID=A0A1B8TVQ9_9FLAO|nr:T9SS type A sorting domain-containing protein [Polaribacter reichenbachii]APZ45419.1 hypothetical protein BW723_03475 [Polaribacter reichenbachii]AUC19280.1 hypothetical protein BTO17_11480 [Polaribacter reichenbachii]OBY63565.1 hypothetical protein LPB301_12225 [Polaribacter reichenbachii]